MSGTPLANIILRRQNRKEVNIVRSVTLLLAALVLISSLIAGCGCLAADSYDKSACQKYHTDWPRPNYDED
jgi:hypothetical protein